MDRSEVKKFICTRWFIFLLIIIVAIGGLITAIVVYEVYKNRNEFKVDCLPDVSLNYNTCMKRKCYWFSSTVEGEPKCIFPKGYGYEVTNKRVVRDAIHAMLEKKQSSSSIFSDEVKTLKLLANYDTRSRLHLKIYDPNKNRYEVPVELSQPTETPKLKDYDVNVVDDPQFGVHVIRQSTKTLIFDSNTPGTIFADQFLQMTIKLPSANIYGLGEHKTPTYRLDVNWKKLSLFARDEGPYNTGINLYGVHPFYMVVERDGNAHGVLLLNSNAMEVVIQPHPAITFRTIGGILDFYIFMGPTPEDVVKQYLDLIGHPMMPPYWSLGFQMCKWGYGNVTFVRNMIEQTIQANIPMDVQFFDIDYMEGNRDFTYDEQNFGDFPSIVNWIHSKNMKAGIILDPAIGSDDKLLGKYPPLDLGLQRDVFVKNSSGGNLQAMVWPGLTYYPDFSKPEAEDYWYELCDGFHKKVNYDALWIDMNEPSSFEDGSVEGCEKNKWNYPPFTANVLGSKKDGKIFEKTICMDAQQHIGKHYDVHSLYGYFHAKVTNSALKKLHAGKRPMVLSRSTYPGSGKYTGHWLGDNQSLWSHLRDSIPGILEFNLFGFPFIGADICGFNGNTTVPLCARWFQLGAFYPFSRNHNGHESIPQHPTALGGDVVRAAKQALVTRYTLLPYLYTLFYYAHVDGATVARPLLHEFPTDKNTWDINFQFLWGAALLITPAVFLDQDQVYGYFPAGVWYDFYTGNKMVIENGKTIGLNAAWDKVNLHIRGGYIIPTQRPGQNTHESRVNSMRLLIAPDAAGYAEGSLFWDDGETMDFLHDDKHVLVSFQLSKKPKRSELLIEPTGRYEDPHKLYFSRLTFYDQDSKPIDIVVNGNATIPESQWDYNASLKVLHVNLQPNAIRLSYSYTIALLRS